MIDQLDEYQGLDAQMVRDWAEDHGYQYRISGLVKCGYVSFANPLRPEAIAWLVPLLADRAKLSPQALLREINPRMRKGWPSRAALEAHGENGDWVVFRNVLHAVRFVWTVCDAVQMVSGFDVFRSDNPEDAAMIAECSFWPCDKHGNKVRWPTDAEGNML